MALGALISNNPLAPSDNAFVPVSCKMSFGICHTDGTVSQSAKKLTPCSITDSAFSWVKVGNAGGRVMFRARMPVASNLTTSPVVVPMGLAGEFAAGSDGPVNTGAVIAYRLDGTDFNAAGITLTLASAGANLNSDATYAYSAWTSLYDLAGCSYFGCLIVTASSLSAGVTAIQYALVN